MRFIISRFIGEEEGQAVALVAVAMSFFLVAAIGLGIDGSHLYAQRQMAQAAADAAAQAAMMSIFDGTNTATTNPAKFSTGATFPCGSSDAKTPCAYANKNGFDASKGDTVSVAFPGSAGAPNVILSGSDPVNVVQVTVTRSVKTTLLRLVRFVAPSATNVTAKATAAIVAVVSPTPIVVTDPTNSNSLSMNGTTGITITGGPTRSIQVNSSSSQAFTGGGTIDLSRAGPNGTGADFGVYGGSTTNPGSVSLGTTGNYVSPASPVLDPLAGVAAPSVPTTVNPPTKSISGTDGCLATCTEYSPGLYNTSSGLDFTKQNVIFKPGIYYVQSTGGVTFKQTTGGGANNSGMCVGCAVDPSTGSGMLIYDSGPAGSTVNNNPTGGFTFDTKTSIALTGSLKGPIVNLVPSAVAPYYGILFWEDRTANAQSHVIGQGNGCFTVVGTIYITNTLAIMQGDSTHHQSVEYHGTPCSNTQNLGEIIVSDLTLKGNVTVNMGLFQYGFLTIRQVALVG
jgi:hypothetical protein